MSIFNSLSDRKDYEVIGRGCLLVCRYCGPEFVHYASPIRSYTCPECVRQEQKIEQAGGRLAP